MSGTFSGIETASRALATSQAVVDVIGHNVANVNTPGYTRQRAEIAATAPAASVDGGIGAALGSIGTGVELKGVYRIQDNYLEQQLLSAGGDQARMSQLRDTLNQVQTAYAEPGQSGLSSMLSAFYNSFQEVARNPEDTSARQSALDAASTLARRFNTLTADHDSVQQSVCAQVIPTFQQADDVARQVAGLNSQIRAALAQGGQPNDLQDQRDQLVKQLGTLVGADATQELDANGKATGALNVSAGGFPLVQGATANDLPTSFTMVGGVPALSQGDERYLLRSGQASGLIQASDTIKGYQATLNGLAAGLISSVNNLHRAGYGQDGSTGNNLFAGTDARSIKLDPAMAANPAALAAATPPAPGTTVAAGNGDNALAIANLANAPILAGGSIGDSYAAHVAQVGADVHSYEQQSTNQAQVIQQLQNMRSSVSGVSLDEELTHMLQFQRSYQAAARLLTVMDSMIDQVVNGLGK